MGSRDDCTWILGLPGFRVETIERGEDAASGRVRVHIERRGRRYPCSGGGRRIRRVRSTRARTWDDLPWAAHPVTLVYRQRRVRCRRCGIRTERIELLIPRRGSRVDCGSRSAWTVSRCRPVTRPCGTP